MFIAPFHTIFNIHSWLVFDLSQLLMFVFSILFLKAFLESYKIERVTKVINILLYLSFIDVIFLVFFGHIIILKFVPSFIFIFFILTEVVRYTPHKDLPFYLIVIGWSIVIGTISLEYMGLLKFLGIEFPFLHIAIALESIILSIAVAYKFKLLEREKEEQKNLLMRQSRMASMGEMVSSIAHQWRQPLNVISFGLMNIKKHSTDDGKTLNIVEKLNGQLDYMSQTMEDFRNFYNPSKVKSTFDIYEACQKANVIADAILEINQIDLSIKVKENFMLYGHQNELEQVILSIITNAKDTAILRKIKNPHIIITIDKPFISIKDNVGGIEKKNLNRIFEPHFTTKEDGDGIGLYLSKMIIEKELGGRLFVESFGEESTFLMKFLE